MSDASDLSVTDDQLGPESDNKGKDGSKGTKKDHKKDKERHHLGNH